MNPRVAECRFEQIDALHQAHLRELGGQCVHWALHRRAGWVEWYACTVDDLPVYGAIVVGGPWTGTRTLFEFFAAREFRSVAAALFEVIVASSRPTGILFQTNDLLLASLAERTCSDLRDDKLLFADTITTALTASGASFLALAETECTSLFEHRFEPVGEWALVVSEEVVGTGGFLTHYNRPYCDLFMEVREDKRRRGFGSYLLQEIKSVATMRGFVSCARCAAANVASIRTLLRAGMAECGRIKQGVFLA